MSRLDTADGGPQLEGTIVGQVELEIGGSDGRNVALANARHRMPMLIVVGVRVAYENGLGARAVQARRLEVDALGGQLERRMYANATTIDHEIPTTNI